MEHLTSLVHLYIVRLVSGCHYLKGVTLEKRLESPFRYDSVITVSYMSQQHESSSDFFDCGVFRTAQRGESIRSGESPSKLRNSIWTPKM
jgi:hypothetical protein